MKFDRQGSALTIPALTNSALTNSALTNSALTNSALTNPALTNPALTYPGLTASGWAKNDQPLPARLFLGLETQQNGPSEDIMAATLPAPTKSATQAHSAPSTGVRSAGRAARQVAQEPSKTLGSMVSLPASAPQLVEWAQDDHVALAAMDAPKPKAPTKAAAKPKATTKPKAPTKPKPPAATPGKLVPTKEPKVWTPPVLGAVSPGKGGNETSHSTYEAGSPDVAYAFNIKIEGVTYGMFSEIGGISWKAEPVPVRSGGNNSYMHNLRGPGKFEPLTMKRGFFAASGEFYKLLELGLQGAKVPTGAAGRFQLTIQVLDRKYQTIGNYDFHECFFVEYTGPAFNAMAGQVGFEQIRVAYDYFEYQPA